MYRHRKLQNQTRVIAHCVYIVIYNRRGPSSRAHPGSDKCTDSKRNQLVRGFHPPPPTTKNPCVYLCTTRACSVYKPQSFSMSQQYPAAVARAPVGRKTRTWFDIRTSVIPADANYLVVVAVGLDSIRFRINITPKTYLHVVK